MNDEDGAFNDIERQSQQRKEAVKAAITQKGILLEMYDAGWNSALERAAWKVEQDFEYAFDKDTLNNIAVFLRGLKK